MAYQELKNTQSFEVEKKILLVEDNIEISNLIELHLKNLDFQIDKAYDGEIGFQKARKNQYSLIILDIFLPSMDGMEICQNLRASGDKTLILMLSARSENSDKVKGFKTGANAYLTKPFNLKTLSDSVNQLISDSDKQTEVKKISNVQCDLQVFKDFTLDTYHKILKVKGVIVPMEEKEGKLLSLLVCNPGIVYSRSEILKLIWGFDLKTYRYKVTSCISKIRQKVEPNFQKPNYILASVEGGFKFNEKILPLKTRIVL